MPPVQIALYVVLGIALAVSAATDIRSRLIYDWVTYPTFIIALVLRLAMVGFRAPTPELADFDMLSGLLGFLICFIPFAAMGYAGGMGGGDVKLMGAVGAALGFQTALWALVFIALVGGLQAILVTLWDGALLSTLGNVGKMFLVALRLRKRPENEPPRKYVPYGVAIALGSIWAVVWSLTHQVEAVSR